MKVAASALVTFAAVPLFPVFLVDFVLLALESEFNDEVVRAPAAFAPPEGDDCAGGSCAFSTLQHRARGVRAKDAAAARRGGSSRLQLSMEALESLVEPAAGNMTFDDENNCTDLTYDCEELAEKWWNCMNLDLAEVPRPPTMSLRPMKFLQIYCRKTCGFCGVGMYTKLSYLRKIRNDEVDKELSYAHIGDFMPPQFTGIFWMDQRGLHKEGTACDPDFKYNFEKRAANEMVFTFGDGAEWNAQTRCLTGHVFTGRQGHWTYMNEGSTVKNRLWSGLNYPSRTGGKFCFIGEGDDHVEIPLKTTPLNWHKAFMTSWYMGEPDNLGQYYVPTSLMRFTMHKTCFGWARKTVIGNELVARLRGQVWYYPIFQIVDGYGRRTEHWDAYIRAANSIGTNCNQTDYYGGEPCNTGDGTSYTPVATMQPIPPDHPAHDQLAWILRASGS